MAWKGKEPKFDQWATKKLGTKTKAKGEKGKKKGKGAWEEKRIGKNSIKKYFPYLCTVKFR